MMMITAGSPVDSVLGELVPLLEAGDVVIDGGNSQRQDTERRVKLCAEQDLLFVGCGVSGGEEGALKGPSLKDERVHASQVLAGPAAEFSGDRAGLVDDLRQALYASKIVSYAQGYQLMRAAAEEYGWTLNNGGIALMWRGGCIIRSAFLGRIKEAFDSNPDLVNLLLDPFFKEAVGNAQAAWRRRHLRLRVYRIDEASAQSISPMRCRNLRREGRPLCRPIGC
jgi:6-phosphogluconate dehydrogenase